MRRSECPHSDFCDKVNSIFYTLKNPLKSRVGL